MNRRLLLRQNAAIEVHRQQLLHYEQSAESAQTFVVLAVFGGYHLRTNDRQPAELARCAFLLYLVTKLYSHLAGRGTYSSDLRVSPVCWPASRLVLVGRSPAKRVWRSDLGNLVSGPLVFEYRYPPASVRGTKTNKRVRKARVASRRDRLNFHGVVCYFPPSGGRASSRTVSPPDENRLLETGARAPKRSRLAAAWSAVRPTRDRSARR